MNPERTEWIHLADLELIQACLKGDQAAFRTLVRQYEPLIAATVTGMLGRCPEADDIGQETFIRFYRSMDRFRGESGLGTYLTRIAMNLCLNELKRRKKRQQHISSTSLEAVRQLTQVERDTLCEADRELINKAIQSLTPKLRSVIVLRLLDGYSTRETADILKIPAGTVLSRLARAQEKLKTILWPDFGRET